MYYVPTMYPYPYYVNASMYDPDFMLRDHQDNSQQVIEAILASVKGESAAIDFYSRLANIAPNQEHRNEILHAVEDKKSHLKQFTDMYITLTGNQPMYEVDDVTFNSYREGLQKAYEIEVENYEAYRKIYLRTQYSPFWDVFWRACNEKVEHAKRFGFLVGSIELKDYGTEPFVVNMEEATKQNRTFRTALWTGSHLQVTVMSIGVGDDIGLEVHPTEDQFLRIEEGQGLVQMGDREDQLDFEEIVYDDYAIMVPAGKWHNLSNMGKVPLKLYTIYAPPEHPFGTVHKTKEEAMAAEEHGH